ncbi:MAG: RNA polymerase sigma factor RpoD/SigA, partial [Deltaproteobacteria bacterium]|nr:RNA polymerase sigma factor RpoD/SigA [Deltaproteobacteria bacterium]
RYINRGLPIQDLIEEGNMGLIKAVERFNASKGCRFSTYATYWIKQSIERGLANHANTVRLPIHVGADIARVNRASRELTAQLKREPGTAEISERTGLSGRYIKKLSLLGKKNCSLDYGLSEDSDLPLMERLPDAAQTAPAELVDQKRTAALVNGWLKKLDRNEQDIVRLRFGLGKGSGKTLEEVGKEFGVTRERIRQIEASALRNLKNIIGQTEFRAADLF